MVHLTNAGLWAEFPHGALHVMTTVRTMTGINKAEDAGRMDAQIGFADVLSESFRRRCPGHLAFRGWIRQETLYD